MIATVYDNEASNFVGEVDKAFYFIIGISFFFLIAITATMIYFVIKYNRKKNIPAVQVKDNTWLEITWTVIPLILVTLMFFYGYWAFIPLRNAPKDAMEITVNARMWHWSFGYPGNKSYDTLVVPVNKNVKLNLVSHDVIHGFFVPAFRLKEDVVPGKNNYTWFKARQIGEYDILCSSYCGMRHSYMSSAVKVVSETDYYKWLAALPVQKVDTAGKEGFAIVQKNGCVACHSLDGSRLVWPSFKGMYGTNVEIEKDGKTIKLLINEAYIRESVYDPDAKIVKNYQGGVMKSYKDMIKEDDLKKIIEYFKGLK